MIMRTRPRHEKRSGFTLVELLVILAIIGLITVIVAALPSRSIPYRQQTVALDKARTILRMISDLNTFTEYTAPDHFWPESGGPDAEKIQFTNSTDYFHHFVTNGWFEDVTPDLFTVGGMKPAGNFSQFTPAHNAWSIVGDITDAYPFTAPVLITRNLGGPGTSFARLNDVITADARGVMDPLSGEPFGARGFVFATRGGAAYALTGKNLKLDRVHWVFKRLDPQGHSLTHVILRPGAGY